MDIFLFYGESFCRNNMFKGYHTDPKVFFWTEVNSFFCWGICWFIGPNRRLSVLICDGGLDGSPGLVMLHGLVFLFPYSLQKP